MNANEYKDSEGNILKVLGLTGLLLLYRENQYYIDSELLYGNEYDIAVFGNRISYYQESDKRVLSTDEKKDILGKGLMILRENKIRVSVY